MNASLCWVTVAVIIAIASLTVGIAKLAHGLSARTKGREPE